MLTLSRMRDLERKRQEMALDFLESRHPRCRECGGSDIDIPVLEDGRPFCCAIADIVNCDEEAVNSAEMQILTDWTGIKVHNIKDAHEGYIRKAIIEIPFEKADIPDDFYPFPDDTTMIQTPQESMDFLVQREELAESFL